MREKREKQPETLFYSAVAEGISHQRRLHPEISKQESNQLNQTVDKVETWYQRSVLDLNPLKKGSVEIFLSGKWQNDQKSARTTLKRLETWVLPPFFKELEQLGIRVDQEMERKKINTILLMGAILLSADYVQPLPEESIVEDSNYLKQSYKIVKKGVSEIAILGEIGKNLDAEKKREKHQLFIDAIGNIIAQ